MSLSNNGRLAASALSFRRRETEGFHRRPVDEIRLLPGEVIYEQLIDGLSFCPALGCIDVLFP
jgi:hypothetical protein